MDFLTGIPLTAGSIFLFLWLPGAALCRIGSWKQPPSAADAFFAGWLWLLVATISLAPFTGSAVDFVTGIRLAAIVMAVLLSLISFFRKKKNNQSFPEFFSGDSLCKLGIMAVVFALLGVFFATHNLGYDDVSNLKYLIGVRDGALFPLYRSLVGYWQAARYPSFGTIYAVIFYGIPGGAFFTYYLLGSLVFSFFLIKVYDRAVSSGNGAFAALSLVGLAAAVLMFAGKDNFFNHGLYPFQQSKLLFLAGLLYIISGWPGKKLSSEFILGSGLLTAAWLHHLNLVILLALFLPFLLTAIWISVPGLKRKLLLSVIALGFSLVAIPSVVRTNQGFIRYKPPPVVHTAAPAKIKKRPSFFERMVKYIDLGVAWLRHGRQRQAYFDRLAGIDIPLLFLLILFAARFADRRRVFYGGLLFSVLVIMLLQTVLTLPRQALLTLYRSGPAVLLIDLLRSEIDWHQDVIYRTDPYTALYISALSNVETRVLTPLQEILYFMPVVSGHARSFLLRQNSTTDTVICNGRFEGRASYLDRQHLVRSWNRASASMQHWLQENNYKVLPVFARELIDIAGEQAMAPIFVWERDSGKNNFAGTGADGFGDQKLRIWRNAAALTLHGIKADEEIVVTFRYRAESVKLLAAVSGARNYLPFVQEITPEKTEEISRFDKSIREEVFIFRTLQSAQEAIFVFWAEGFGHFGRLGMIEAVTVKRNVRHD